MNLTKNDVEFDFIRILEDERGYRKYYCLKSIKNFLYHFDEVKDKQFQKDILELLNGYLQEVDHSPIYNMLDGTELCNKYIYPVGKIYERFYNFMPYIRKSSIIYLASFFIVTIYIFNLPLISYVFVSACFLGYYSYIMIKARQKRTYGFCY
jgi:hypothetical protein